MAELDVFMIEDAARIKNIGYAYDLGLIRLEDAVDILKALTRKKALMEALLRGGWVDG